MRLIIYDVEVFKHDWLVTFKDKETGKFTCIWNDSEALKQCISDDEVYIGFNSKSYDQYIIKAICCDLEQSEIKGLNDFIIEGNQGWLYPALKDHYFSFNNVDIRDDMQMGLSLKAIEGHLGLSVKESTVPFDIDRPLTEEEKRETEHYCKHDVDTTEKLVDLRKDYLKTKIDIGKLAGLDDVKAMSMTNAKLTAELLQAKRRVDYTDERDYQYPDNLKREYIPQEVFDFFDRSKDPSLSDSELFSSKIEIVIGDCPVTMGYGGIHGAINNYIKKSSKGRVIKNFDVASYYPNLMVLYGYCSRNIPSPDLFREVLEKRLTAKAEKNIALANALKLVCNTAYGAGLNQYNELYDPLMGRSVCITGQLFLLELAQNLYQNVPELVIVQLNTDGLMIECNERDYRKVLEITEEWQKRTGFALEEDSIAMIAQKDVNNYVEVQSDGKTKTKGGYLVRGISPAGAFNINNNACIVATALKEYFVNGISIEETINECEDILEFQFIAKAGSKYLRAYHLIDGEEVPVQKVNRVYASKDERYGRLYKVKADNEIVAKIENLPEHCIIDNDNRLSIEDIDKSFYIELAKKRVNDFMGEKPERKTKKNGRNKNE